MSNFKIKELLDKIMFVVFNLVSDINLFFKFKTRSILSKNVKYKNLHKGEKCFILGTGPSLEGLTKKEINFLEDEIVFGVNSFYKVTFLSSVKPRYYVLADNNYWGIASYTFKDIRNTYYDCHPTFITDVRASRYLEDDTDAMFFYAKNYPIKSKFRGDLSGNVSITMNVVSFSIIAAIYMGFKEIYLLGCDYNLFCQKHNLHCYDDTEEKNELPTYNLAFYLKYYALTTEFHYHISEYAKKNKVKIINLTDGSLLDAYPIRPSKSFLCK